jgi:hypothetical protein
MDYNKILEQAILFGLLIAVIGTGYIFIATIIFKEKTFGGIFNAWQFPMLLAILIDMAYYEHLNNISNK